VVPDVEQVSRELEALALAHGPSLGERHIPVLLEGATESIAAQGAEAGRTVDAHDRRGNEGGRIQISGEALLDASGGQSSGAGEAGGQAGTGGSGNGSAKNRGPGRVG